MSSEPLLITGYFNIHMDEFNNTDTMHLSEILETMGLQQHVTQSTHEKGHILDLVITRWCDDVIDGVPILDYLFSDHFSVLCNLKMTKPVLPISIDIDKFNNDLAKSDLCFNKTRDLDELVYCYNRTLISVFDCHAPLQVKTITDIPLVPWFSNEIKVAKMLCRKEMETYC